jgi:hypothetical protein
MDTTRTMGTTSITTIIRGIMRMGITIDMKSGIRRITRILRLCTTTRRITQSLGLVGRLVRLSLTDCTIIITGKAAFPG